MTPRFGVGGAWSLWGMGVRTLEFNLGRFCLGTGDELRRRRDRPPAAGRVAMSRWGGRDTPAGVVVTRPLGWS